jgi:hypothetical protein
MIAFQVWGPYIDSGFTVQTIDKFHKKEKNLLF